jgi:GPH family glycoside/pentoside/hexuronide:cation symporter
LAAVGFQANVDPSEDVLMGLRLLMSLIPAGLGVLCAVPMLFYKLDAERMKTIEEELTARRAEAEAGADTTEAEADRRRRNLSYF